jgi:nitroreductase
VAQLSLQAVALGLVTHPMAGFDAAAARERFAVPYDFVPLVLLAVGTLGDPSTLDPELAAKDGRPRTRRPLSEIAFSGRWGTPALG